MIFLRVDMQKDGEPRLEVVRSLTDCHTDMITSILCVGDNIFSSR